MFENIGNNKAALGILFIVTLATPQSCKSQEKGEKGVVGSWEVKEAYVEKDGKKVILDVMFFNKGQDWIFFKSGKADLGGWDHKWKLDSDTNTLSITRVALGIETTTMICTMKRKGNELTLKTSVLGGTSTVVLKKN